jgi:hypothetical protein
MKRLTNKTLHNLLSDIYNYRIEEVEEMMSDYTLKQRLVMLKDIEKTWSPSKEAKDILRTILIKVNRNEKLIQLLS